MYKTTVEASAASAYVQKLFQIKLYFVKSFIEFLHFSKMHITGFHRTLIDLHLKILKRFKNSGDIIANLRFFLFL